MSDVLLRSWLPHVVNLVAWCLLNSLWQGAIVALVVSVTLGTLRRPIARVRYAIVSSGLGGIVLSCVMPWSSVDGALSTRVAEGIVVCWILGVLVLFIRLLGGWYLLRQLREEPPAAACALAVRRLCERLRIVQGVTVVTSPRITTPGLIGWWRPVIVIPPSALMTASGHDVEAILAHEVAHVCRGDYLANVLQTVVDVVFFFHPAVWWLSRQARAEREYCCDDVAAALFADPLAYAEALVRLEQARLDDRPPDGVPSGGEIVARVRRLTERSNPIAAPGAAAWAPVVLFTVATPLLLWVGHAGLSLASVIPFRVLSPVWPALSTTLSLGTVLGLLLGMRHACEPDHLLAVSTLMSGERTAVRATALGVSWGMGHTVSLFTVGAVLAVAHLQLSSSVSGVFEFSVSLMLIALGGRAIVAAWRQGADGPPHVHAHGAQTHQHQGAVDHVHVLRWPLARRPLLVGMVHGLAGSGALTALVVANLPTVSAQVAYIVVFGAGSTIGMAALSAFASWPMARFVRGPVAIAVLSGLSGGLSIAYGVLSGLSIVWRWVS